MSLSLRGVASQAPNGKLILALLRLAAGACEAWPHRLFLLNVAMPVISLEAVRRNLTAPSCFAYQYASSFGCEA